jgi:hypothetical protein
MIKNGKFGANTKTGLYFEDKIDLIELLKSLKGYECIENELTKKKKEKWYDVYYKKEFVASVFKKNALYVYLKHYGIEWKKFISKKLLPDNAIYVVLNNTLYIIEIKYQEVAGSVDEKLQTCDFKKKQYMKLFSYLNYRIEYIYVLSDWFTQEGYKDVLNYIIDMGCRYYFNYIPLQELGLPIPDEN